MVQQSNIHNDVYFERINQIYLIAQLFWQTNYVRIILDILVTYFFVEIPWINKSCNGIFSNGICIKMATFDKISKLVGCKIENIVMTTNL